MLENVFRYGEIFLSAGFFIYLLLVTITIILDNRPPVVSMAWLITLYFLPYFGIIIYLYMGVNWRKRKIMKQLPEDFIGNSLTGIIDAQKEYLSSIRNSDDNDLEKCMTLLLGGNHSVITFTNALSIFHDGDTFFTQLLHDLEYAKTSIHLQFFIWRSDNLGKRIQSILLKKAREGVEIKLIFDGVGCFMKMSRKYRKELRRNGIEYRYFLDPLNPLSGRLVNYRNHRKIAVIDGMIAYTGGMNIGDEYITGGKRFRSWRDTGVRLEFDGVKMLQMIFLTDWYNSGGRLSMEKKYFPLNEGASDSHVKIQVATSGPDSRWHSIKQMIFTMINNANSEVLIQSPYFIPDETIINSMETAALSGVKIRLMMTGVPDKRVPFWVAQTYFESLIAAGVEIFLYTEGFFHPKVVVVDRRYATLGTCNMDVRSFHLDYEVNLSLYDTGVANQLAAQFEKDLDMCQMVVMTKTPVPVRLRNSLLRVLSPLL